jgi:hypothetical protein
MPDLDQYEAYYAEKLWTLLPEIYRSLDASVTDHGPLREIVDRIGAQAAIVRRSIDRTWEDQSIETCDSWVIAYIADVLATNLVDGLDARGQRLDVAKTIYYRRRKGTLAVLDELAHDITGWDARSVEFFRRLARARHGLDPQLGAGVGPPAGFTALAVKEGLIGRVSATPMGGFADLRRDFGASRAHGAFDEYAHHPDVRRARGALGWYGIPRLGVFLWRLSSVPVDGVTPVAVLGCPNQFTFDPTGRDSQLFAAASRAYGDDWVSPEEHELPTPINARLLAAELPNLYAAVDWSDGGKLYPHSLSLYDGDTSISAIVPVSQISADAQSSAGKYFIDPERGRLYAPAGADTSVLLVGYRYGFSSNIGAGGYDRRVRGQSAPVPTPVVEVSGGGSALSTIGPTGTVVLKDSRSYSSAPDVVVSEQGGQNSLVLRADNRQRPLIRLPVPAPTPHEWSLSGSVGANGNGSELMLDGLFASSGELVLKGDFELVTLSSVTLDPGAWQLSPAEFARAADGRRLIAGRLRVQGNVRKLQILRSIVGPIVIEGAGNLQSLVIQDSIVQAVEPSALAIDNALGLTDITRSTVFGAARVHQLEATDSIFEGVITVADHQHGCVRFSAYAAGSVLPRPYESVEVATGTQLFASRSFGQAAYAQLLPSVDPRVGAGAESGSEMGAFSRENNPIKERSLLIKYQEYMPLGLYPALIYMT